MGVDTLVTAQRDFDPEHDVIPWVSIGADAARTGAHTGLKALMLAVLENGIAAYLAAPGRRRDEAEAWITAGRHHSPFAFAVVCETLGLEPGAVRATLQAWRAENRSPRELGGRQRGNVRRTERLRPTRVRRTRRRRSPPDAPAPKI
jgi:hypothetical protein